MTKELYNYNIKHNPLFKPELFVVGAKTPICNKKPKNDLKVADGEKNCCQEACPPNPVGAHYVCSLCNCVLVPNPE